MKMATSALKTSKTALPQTQIVTVVSHALSVIHTQGGYTPITKSNDLNTVTLVKKQLETVPLPVVHFTYRQLAEEIVDFFRHIRSHSDYKAIREREDGPLFESCADAAQHDEVTPVTFPFVVLMTNLYAVLDPRKPHIDPDKMEVKLLEPGHFLGTLFQPEKFFVKLVGVGRKDQVKGTTFQVSDRNGNIAFFQDRMDRYVGKVYLNDCFYIVATPVRHLNSSDGQKHTFFRSNVQPLLNDIRQGKGEINQAFDESVGKKFCRDAF